MSLQGRNDRSNPQRKNRIASLHFVMFTITILLLLASLTQCKKDSVNGTGISFSNDTLTFDTVFTTLGSTTQRFKVYNRTGQDITIDNIKLMGLQGSQFRINVDGISGTNFNNVEVLAKDSIYVFVEVTVNPNDASAPFVINDEIQFSVHDETAKVVLNAWGQNAYYHLGETYSTANPQPAWQTDKPHIVVAKNGIGIAVSQGATFTIPSGTRLYMASNSLISIDGNLVANANAGDSISFNAIRHHEEIYKNRPGQWLGIIYSRTANVQMTRCTINESVLGLSDEHAINALVGQTITTSQLPYTADPIPTVTLDKVIIKNTAGTALTAIKTNLTAKNSLFYTTGGNVVGIFLGGTYNFTNCTMANVYTQFVDHNSESLVIADRIAGLNNTLYTGSPLSATFVNCIAYGGLENEVAFASENPASQISFQNCLLKIEADTFTQVSSANCILNENPQFKNYTQSDYTPDTGSPLINSGILITGSFPTPTDDLYGNPRIEIPDIGAIEAQ